MKQSFVVKHNVCGDSLSITYSMKVPLTKFIPHSRSVSQSLCTTINLKGNRVKETAIGAGVADALLLCRSNERFLGMPPI